MDKVQPNGRTFRFQVADALTQVTGVKCGVPKRSLMRSISLSVYLRPPECDLGVNLAYREWSQSGHLRRPMYSV